MSLKTYVVNMRSDTFTKPTPSMRDAMAKASVGDDVYGEDPTVNELQRRMAEILGKEDSLFVPSGTMANLIAIMVHCERNRCAEVFVGDQSHIFKYEQGGCASIAGAQMTIIKNHEDGTLDMDELEYRVRGADIHEPYSTLIAVENTHNMCGGKVLPLTYLDDIAKFAKKHNLLLHMDGARLFNASEFLNVQPSVVVKHFDSVSVCFSKCLGAPVGSILAGSSLFIDKARRIRKLLGGGMRQVGVLAAAALVSLDEIVPALIGDHRRAKIICQAVNTMRSSIFTVDVSKHQTNILLINIDPKSNIYSEEVCERLKKITAGEMKDGCHTEDREGIIVEIISKDATSLRITTHFEITDVDVSYAVKKMIYVFKEFADRQPKKGFF